MDDEMWHYIKNADLHIEICQTPFFFLTGLHRYNRETEEKNRLGVAMSHAIWSSIHTGNTLISFPQLTLCGGRHLSWLPLFPFLHLNLLLGSYFQVAEAGN